MKIIGNLKEFSWTNDLKVNPENIPYSIGFKIFKQENILFKNLSFSICIFKDNENIFSKSYPENGQKFISSNQTYLISDLVENTKPITEYSVSVSATNDGKTFDGHFTIITPEPFKPFSSWSYDSDLGDFVPPVPYPEDKKDYRWSESSQSWIVLKNIQEG